MGRWEHYHGKILLYFDKALPVPHYGDVLLVKGSPEEVQPPMNPGVFDYKQFLAYRHIHHQDYLREGQFITIGQQPLNQIDACSDTSTGVGRSGAKRICEW